MCTPTYIMVDDRHSRVVDGLFVIMAHNIVLYNSSQNKYLNKNRMHRSTVAAVCMIIIGFHFA